MNIRQYIKQKKLICDGAMGTYYSEITGNDSCFCELSNIENPLIIESIHKEYVEAGARLIRTNTFSANMFTLGKSRKDIDSIISSGINIAKGVADKEDVFVAASIGPIRNDEIEDADNLIVEEYKSIIDVFLQNKIDIFIFETFSSTIYLEEITKYIKEKNREAFILVSFAIKPDGFSRDGISGPNLMERANSIEYIDGLGLNCASGPTMTFNNLKEIYSSVILDKPFSIMPNAGFPMVVHERSVFTDNPKYFATKIKQMSDYGCNIVGGCCGTKPSYIKAISSLIHVSDIKLSKEFNKKQDKDSNKISYAYGDEGENSKNTFLDKLNSDKFVVTVELSAPIDNDIAKVMESARLCKDYNIDMVTIPDSPMGRVRANSVIIASKIKREIGIEAMPHMCCRDKNINAIRSELIGAHIEGIRNILAITGDPISDAKTSETKGVFNLNSYKLIKLIQDTNENIFKGEPVNIGAALNLNVINTESEYSRMKKKIENGAQFFMTQPIYYDEKIKLLKRIKDETGAKILGGVLPIVTYKNAMFLNNELPGVSIPNSIVNRFSPDMSKEEAQNVGIEIAIELGKKLKEVCSGLYIITPFNRVSMVSKIIDGINEE